MIIAVAGGQAVGHGLGHPEERSAFASIRMTASALHALSSRLRRLPLVELVGAAEIERGAYDRNM
jgi:hypothetical protein